MTARVSVGRLAEAFDELLDLDATARRRWLDAATLHPSDRVQLERMLAADDQHTSGFLDASAAEHALALESEADAGIEPADLVGKQFGPFRLTALLGQGGMATVFLGQRVGADFDQQVAVKVLRRGLYSSIEQQLFRRERQLLAQLDHPNIARLIDGGLTEAGIPYLVMEFVDGLRLDQHMRTHRLDLRARLRLFVEACGAVQAAHQALIVHRDIKPSNILVTAGGSPKLLDFGIAKLLVDDPSGAPTRTLTAALTPGYAAPEQMAGGSVTTVADIYALGVVLHEILTGARPVQADVVLASASVKAGDDDGRLPLAPAALRRALRGDLDNIIMRALSPEPLRRYASVEAFVEDIESYLDGRPVKAHPPSRWYLTAKFARRHSVAVAVTLVLTAIVLLALGAALWQAQVARSQAQRAGEVQRFVETMFEPLESGNDNGSAPTLQELLQRGLERIDQRNPRDPQLRAELLAMFARINDGIGEVHGNVALVEAAWQANVEAWGPDDQRTLDVRVLLAKVLRRDGQFQRAYEEIEAARAAMQRAGVGGIAYAQVLDAHLNARMSVSRVSNEEAVRLRREYLRLREADPAASPGDIAGGYNNLGDALEDKRDYAAAADAYRRAYELRYAALGDSAAAAHSLANLGNTYAWRKQWHKAIDILDAARRMYDRARITRHPYYADLLIRLCHLRTLIEDRPGATADCAASLAMTEAVLGNDRSSYAMALVRDAGRAVVAGDPDGAARGFARARALFAAGASSNGGNLRTTDIAEAARWRLLGDMSTLRDRLQPIADRQDYVDHWAAPLIFAWLAQACDAAPAPTCGDGRRAAAEALLAQPRFRDDPLRLPARTALARIDLRRGEGEHAARELQREIDAVREIGPQHSWLGEAYLVLSLAQTNDRDARQSLARARAIIDALPAGHPMHAALAAGAVP